MTFSIVWSGSVNWAEGVRWVKEVRGYLELDHVGDSDGPAAFNVCCVRLTRFEDVQCDDPESLDWVRDEARRVRRLNPLWSVRS